jgi:hypothetical protein
MRPVFKSELDSYVPSEEEIIKHKIENNHIWQQYDEEEKQMQQERERDPFEYELFERENYGTD